LAASTPTDPESASRAEALDRAIADSIKAGAFSKLPVKMLDTEARTSASRALADSIKVPSPRHEPARLTSAYQEMMEELAADRDEELRAMADRDEALRRIAAALEALLLEGDALGGAAETDQGSIRLTPMVVDILQTLAEAKGRLTRKRLLEAMCKADREHGLSTVGNMLPKLREAGLIDNRQDVDPVGFAITEKGRTALARAQSHCL
jgi:hypothetical protein